MANVPVFSKGGIVFVESEADSYASLEDLKDSLAPGFTYQETIDEV